MRWAAEVTEQSGVAVADLTIVYGTTVALDRATFKLEPGSITGVLGPNGSGKTSLLKGVLGLVKAQQGSVSFDGLPLSRVRRRVGYVPQHKEVDWDFPITAAEMTLLGTYPALGPFKYPRKRERDWAARCLSRLQLAGVADRQIGKLSGGQQQRTFIARALAQQPRYLFLDEPFVGVDIGSEELIIEVLAEMRADGVTLAVVDHDLERAEEIFDQVLLVENRIVAAGKPDSVLTSDRIAQVYLGKSPRRTSARGGSK